MNSLWKTPILYTNIIFVWYYLGMPTCCEGRNAFFSTFRSDQYQCLALESVNKDHVFEFTSWNRRHKITYGCRIRIIITIDNIFFPLRSQIWGQVFLSRRASLRVFLQHILFYLFYTSVTCRTINLWLFFLCIRKKKIKIYSFTFKC